MGVVRIYNPATINPRRAKPWTQKQAADRKDKAETFTRDVIEDDADVDEIADMTPAEYAESRGKEVIENPTRRRSSMKRKSSVDQDDAFRLNSGLSVANNKLLDQNRDLQHRVDKLRAKNAGLQVKLDKVDDILASDDDDYTESERLDDVQDVIDETGGGNGNGSVDDDDDDD